MSTRNAPIPTIAVTIRSSPQGSSAKVIQVPFTAGMPLRSLMAKVRADSNYDGGLNLSLDTSESIHFFDKTTPLGKDALVTTSKTILMEFKDGNKVLSMVKASESKTQHAGLFDYLECRLNTLHMYRGITLVEHSSIMAICVVGEKKNKVGTFDLTSFASSSANEMVQRGVRPPRLRLRDFMSKVCK
jgi:hypothetical protein